MSGLSLNDLEPVKSSIIHKGILIMLFIFKDYVTLSRIQEAWNIVPIYYYKPIFHNQKAIS